MIFFDISDTSIEAVRLSTSFLTGEAISAFARVELEKDLIEAGEIKNRDALSKVITNLLEKAKPKAMKDQECAFTLPDKRVYTCRLQLSQRQDSQTVFELVKAQMEKSIPQPIEELIYRFTSLDRGKGSGEIFLVAVPTTLVNSYIELFNTLALQPRLVAPESFTIYNFLGSVIKEDETLLYLDVGKTTATATLMDKQGVIEAFTEPIESDKLLDQTKGLLTFTRERLGRSVKRVILGGGGSLGRTDIAQVKANLKIEVESVEKAFENFRMPIRVDFGEMPRILFVNTFGLAALSKEKQQPLNLLP